MCLYLGQKVAIGQIIKRWYSCDALEPMTALSWGKAEVLQGQLQYNYRYFVPSVTAVLFLFELL